MAHIISFCNQKGGVGKTTSAVNLAAYLAAFGKRVLLVDFDPQGNATSAFFKDKSKIGKTIYHALINKDDPFDIIKKTLFLNVDIAPANATLAGASIELATLKDREFRLKKILQKVEKRYDYIIIDLPPSLGLFMVNALVASEHIIVPIQCEYYALEGLAELLKTVNLVNKNLGAKSRAAGKTCVQKEGSSRRSRSHRGPQERVIMEGHPHRNFLQ